MAKKLSTTETRSQESLERNMDARILAYKNEKEQQLKDGKKAALIQELTSLEAYLLGCRNSEISDTLTNIQFAQRKKEVLQNILK